MCLPSFRVTHLNFGITCVSSVKFRMKTLIICRRGFRYQSMQILVISSCCLQRMARAVQLLFPLDLFLFCFVLFCF